MQMIVIRIISFLILLSLTTSQAAEVFYYSTDNVGTPVTMWDKNGKKVWEGEYYPFGEEYQVSEAPKKNDKRFIGKEKDKETGLTYFGSRYMDEGSGRFLQPDPVRPVDAFTSQTNHKLIQEPQRLNRYAYGLNNPYRYIDLDGNSPIDVEPPASMKNHPSITNLSPPSFISKEQVAFFAATLVATGNPTLAVEAGFGARSLKASKKGANFFNSFKKRKAYDHQTRHLGDFTEFSVKVPGNKSGYTKWVKTVNGEGKTVKMYHDTFDNTGKFLHRSIKKPGPNRHIYRNGKVKKD